MPLIEHQTIVAVPIIKVWAFFTDPVRNLPRISPPAAAVVIESADLPIKDGSKITVAMKDPLGRRVRWESQIEQYAPPHAVVFGFEARFVDVQLSGPFHAWKHEHEFEAIDAKTTRVLDRVTYTPPMGLLGAILNLLVLRWYLRRVLRHRGEALKRELEQ